MDTETLKAAITAMKRAASERWQWKREADAADCRRRLARLLALIEQPQPPKGNPGR